MGFPSTEAFAGGFALVEAVLESELVFAISPPNPCDFISLQVNIFGADTETQPRSKPVKSNGVRTGFAPSSVFPEIRWGETRFRHKAC
ncbi:hypothetical protein X768_12720 [Mesorhizobium sp. LSJC265A00]|uniref:hypothetical protein n=1 Tax=unclassified Mesorhizobium TaxID=325217 RepID=UPI0003CE0998|nr:hypothetical protein [Mesorhizobium sp. LSJC265A00]ESX11036.1 hypothetical protein X768_12720 [Mesorhizobium sp. LSJC265A00]